MPFACAHLNSSAAIQLPLGSSLRRRSCAVVSERSMLSRSLLNSSISQAQLALRSTQTSGALPTCKPLLAAAAFRSSLSRSLRKLSKPDSASARMLLGKRGAARSGGAADGPARGMSAECVASPVTDRVVVPENLHGFEFVRDEYVKEYGSHAAVFKHTKTGAEVVSLTNDDENKVFGIVLRTPPKDSTGLPHILEHSVLCGSRKYPVKEPFVELIKGSLNTFLNAFTYPDRTCYPVASTNLQDFYNLMDVYLDAVFFPRLNEQVFQQEGWHYELDKPEDEMIFKGVVFNEMKGVYSQPDSIMGRLSQTSLFPDNTYGVDSGGDPERIPDLKFDDFMHFHQTYYHPSNARIWFYGDDPVEERLKKLDEYLSLFERKEVDSSIGLQTKFSEPKDVAGVYAASAQEGEETSAKGMYTLNWLLAEDKMDIESELAWEFLDHLLLGTSASPLKKALTESGFGEAVIGGGLENELLQPSFSIGLKGVNEGDYDKVQALVTDTLAQLAKDGFTESAIESSMNTIEFGLRENNTGSFPRGLALMLRSMTSWLYDRDPLEPLKLDVPLQNLKDKLAAGEKVFEPLLEELLANQHRVSVTVRPSPDEAGKVEAVEKARLAEVRGGMKEDDIQDVVKTTALLKEKQETPDPPEALTCIPGLSLSDIPKECKKTPTEVGTVSGSDVTLLTHDLFTNEVLYVDVAYNIKTIPQELLPLLPLFSRCLKEMGTDQESFVELSQRIGRKTGGISVSTFTSSVRDAEEGIGYLVMRGKSMRSQAEELMAIMKDMVLSAKLDDKDRFLQMALETKARMEAGIAGAGHRFAASRLNAMDNGVGYVQEKMSGYEYLVYIRQLVKRIEGGDWAGVQADLETIRTCVVAQKGMVVNLTADEQTLEESMPHIESFVGALPKETGSEEVQWSSVLTPRNEALVLPTQVNYVGKAANLFKDGYKYDGSALVIHKLLGTTWLWDRVRVSGGAYGAFSNFDSQSGLFTYLSYRDPNLMKTLDNYDGTVDFLRNLDLSEDELTKAIIGCIGDLDSYQLPDAKGYSALLRHLLKVTDEERQQRRDEVLGTTLASFREHADVLATVAAESANVVAVCSPKDAESVNAERQGFLHIEKTM